MLIGSVLVSGQEQLSRTLVRGFQLSTDISQRISEATLLIVGAPGTLGSLLVTGAPVQIYSGLIGGEITGGPVFGETPFGEDVFGGIPEGVIADVVFSGLITKVTPRSYRMDNGHEFTEYTLNCRDWGTLLDSAVVSTPASYVDQDDQSIIRQLFADYLPGIDTTEVGLLAIVNSLAIQTVTLRQALDQICNLTGGEYSIVPGSQKLRYYSPTGTAAPFSIKPTGQADNVNSFAPLKESFQYTEDFSAGANRITVLGKGSIKQTVNDAGSQGQHGILSTVLVDRNIQSDLEAQARGNVELVKRSQPQKSGSFTIRHEGLDVGQLVTIDMVAAGVSGSFLIRRVTRTWKNPYETWHQVEFGDYRPDLVKMLRALQAAAGEKPYLLETEVGEITIDNFAASIEPIQIVNSLPALPDTNYSQNAVVLLTTDRKLYRRSMDTWTAYVPAVDLSGQITETQITDNSITTPKINALAITSQKLAAEAVTIGKIAADAIIAGTIGAGAIRAQDVAFESGCIQTADIGDLQVTNAKIANAQITGGKIASVTITNANIQGGTITDNEIQAGTITGAKIKGGEITNAHMVDGTISGTKITDATIYSSKIFNLTADKISAGTITASISIQAATITGSTLTLNKNGVITLISNDFDQTGYAGLKIYQSSLAAVIFPGAFYARNGSGTFVAGLESWSGGQGLVRVMDSSGVSAVRLDGSSGLVLAAGKVLTLGNSIAIGDNPTGYLRFNNQHYALWCGSNGKKIVSGTGTFNGDGSQPRNSAIVTSLSAVDTALAISSGGVSRIGIISIAGGTVTFQRPTGDVVTNFYWLAFGSA